MKPEVREQPRQAFPTVRVGSMEFARLTQAAVVDRIFGALSRGEGGWLITANVDHLHRHSRDPEIRRLYADAELIVADGTPILWASRLAGTPLPERVARSDLVWPLTRRAAAEGRSVYFLGGEPGAGEAALARFLEELPSFRLAGMSSPRISLPPEPAEIEAVREDLAAARPDLVYVALGSPKQELLISELRADFPRAWMLGVGISLSFVGGMVQRAPVWMQRLGLEFLHRLMQEPRRLARRYLVDDLGFALGLLARSLVRRGSTR